MKFLVSLLMLSLAVASYAAVTQEPASHANLSVGSISAGDRLLHRGYLRRQVGRNSYQDLTFRGSATTRVSAVQITELGSNRYAICWIIQGGVGYNFVTVRAQSVAGWGYHYAVYIWGR